MTITPRIQRLINQVVSTVSFPNDPTSCLTPKDRANHLEAALKKMVKGLTEHLVPYKCPHCGKTEYLYPAHETPMHRHDKLLYILRQPTP